MKINNLTADKLRKSILQLAIQGKLVKQNPDDEPASELVKKIYAEKQKLIAEGKIKKDKTESYIYKGDDNRYYEKIGKNEPVDITDDLPFDIPDSWEWIRLPSLANFYLGKTPERNNLQNWGNDFPWVSIADMKDKSIINHTKEKISNYALSNKFNNQFSPKGTLIMSFKLTVGRTSLLDMDAVHNEAIISIIPYISTENITKIFLLNLLGLLVEYCDTTDAIKGATLNKL